MLPERVKKRILAAIINSPGTGAFKGSEHLGMYAGHGTKSIGAVFDPAAFAGVVIVAPGILGLRHGVVAIDLVEPGVVTKNSVRIKLSRYGRWKEPTMSPGTLSGDQGPGTWSVNVAPRCSLTPAEFSRWTRSPEVEKFMRLGVGIDDEARRLSARRQSYPVLAVQPIFHLDSPSQAKDDSASRDNSPGSRRSVVAARTRS